MRNGIFFATAVLLASWGGPAQACQLELDALYSIHPLEDDGLSNAERVECPRGTLSFYRPETAWTKMRDEAGDIVIARDIDGTYTDQGDLIAVILDDGRVAMRWGDAGERFFLTDATHNTFLAYRGGVPMTGRRIGEVSLDRLSGLLHVGIEVSGAEYCEIVSDEALMLDWSWTCFPAARAKPTDAARGQNARVPVTVGLDPEGDACPSVGRINGNVPGSGGVAPVYAGPGAGYPVIDTVRINTPVHACDADEAGTWEGIVYPLDGRDCGVSSPMRPVSYAGPCKSGWIDPLSLTITAG